MDSPGLTRESFSQERLRVVNRRGKVYGEAVLARQELARHIEPVRHIHVIGLADGLAVEGDFSNCVEPVTFQVDPPAIQQSWVGLECPEILPVGFVDPGDLELIITLERVFDLLYAHQVQVDTARHMRPECLIRTGLPELPPATQLLNEHHLISTSVTYYSRRRGLNGSAIFLTFRNLSPDTR